MQDMIHFMHNTNDHHHILKNHSLAPVITMTQGTSAAFSLTRTSYWLSTFDTVSTSQITSVNSREFMDSELVQTQKEAVTW